MYWCALIILYFYCVFSFIFFFTCHRNKYQTNIAEYRPIHCSAAKIFYRFKLEYTHRGTGKNHFCNSVFFVCFKSTVDRNKERKGDDKYEIPLVFLFLHRARVCNLLLKIRIVHIVVFTYFFVQYIYPLHFVSTENPSILTRELEKKTVSSTQCESIDLS